jgi:molybdopterin-synthase adenylyltransferase
MIVYDLKERYIRQRDIIPAERLAKLMVTVVGVGAIGRQVALQLAAIGVSKLQLVDFDWVGVENLAPQGYLEEDIGRAKVAATAVLCRKINQDVETLEENGRFRKSMEIGQVLFACVDSIDTRRLIWQAVKDKVDLFVDTRMSAEVVRILAAADPAGRAYIPHDALYG